MNTFLMDTHGEITENKAFSDDDSLSGNEEVKHPYTRVELDRAIVTACPVLYT